MEILQKSQRFNVGKIKWTLVHFKSIECMVEVLTFGAKKYSPDNWKIGLNLKEIEDSIQRHLASLIDGEIKDPESGLYHIGHIMCNCMFWMYHHNKNLKDVEEKS